jgi:hypothetical protein
VWAPGATQSNLGFSFLLDCAGRAPALRDSTSFARAYLRSHPNVHHPL